MICFIPYPRAVEVQDRDFLPHGSSCMGQSLLTERPQAVRGSALHGGLFLVLSVTRRRPPLGLIVVRNLIVKQAACKVYSPKAVEY